VLYYILISLRAATRREVSRRYPRTGFPRRIVTTKYTVALSSISFRNPNGPAGRTSYSVRAHRLGRLARVDQSGLSEVTHFENGIGNRSEIRGLSSTPEACSSGNETSRQYYTRSRRAGGW